MTVGMVRPDHAASARCLGPAFTSRPRGLWRWGSARPKLYLLASDPDVVDQDAVEAARDALEIAEANRESMGNWGSRSSTAAVISTCFSPAPLQATSPSS